MSTLIALIWTVIFVVCQVLIFNHLSLAGGVVLLYLYMAVKLPVELPRPLQIFLGFIVGLVIDMFANTPGMHALAYTTLMWVRLPLLHMFIVAEDIKNGSPTLQKLGLEAFMRYLITIVVAYCILLYLIESFTLFNLTNLLIKIAVSSVMTFIMILAIEIANSRR